MRKDNKTRRQRLPEEQPKDECVDAAEYLVKNLSGLPFDRWDFVTNVLTELADRTDVRLWSDIILPIFLLEASRRAETGKNGLGESLENQAAARAILKDLFKIVAALREGKPLPKILHYPYGYNSAAEQNAAELKKLEARLEKLRDGDDITDSSAILRLEKKIYDLKRQPSEEWPEFVGG